MSHRVPFLSTSLLLALALPAQRVQPYPLPEPDDHRAAIEAGTRTPEGRPGPEHWQDRVRYRLEARLHPATADLEGHAELAYENRSPRPLRRLVVHLRQNLHRAGAQRTRDVEVTGGMEIENVRVDGVEPEGRRAVRRRDTRLFVELPEPLPPGESTTLSLDWSFTVPRAGHAPRNGHEDHHVYYLAYWYPQFAVRDDVEGWVADRYRGNGEFYMPYGDYDVAMTVPEGFLVRATGTLDNPGEVLTGKARAALATADEQREVVHVITADDLEQGRVTAPATNDEGTLTWRFTATDVRDVAVSVSDRYVWDATHAVVPDGDGGERRCAIHAVYEPDAGSWDGAAEYARHTIEFMSRRVHPYPWPHMTACEGVIGGGMEFPMMTIIGAQGKRRESVQGIIAHELIHMWFPMLVGSNEKRYAWQDEGFTSFFTALVRDDFWERATGTVRGIAGYARNVARGRDAPCMRHADGYPLGGFGFASYSKTAAILHQLRGMLGDEAFFAAFRRYTADWAFKHPYPWDFFRSFSASTGRDLDAYFRMWFFETWTLDTAVAGVEQDGDTARITLEDRGLAFHPTVVRITRADGATVDRRVPMETWRKTREVALEVPGEVTEVVIDPEIRTLDVDRGNNVWER